MNLIENLKWRYATKKYNSSKTVSPEDLNQIKEAIQLTATSYGLQLFKVLDVEDKALREKLQPASWGQPQITEASHLFVFCGYADVKDEHIDEFMEVKAGIQNLDINTLSGYGGFVKGKMSEFPLEFKQVWTAKQTYIALGNAMSACAELKIDSTPMEGFDPAAYDEILGLSAKGLKADVVLTIGYRSDEDKSQHALKVRKPMTSLFERI
jgi:nitroreductase